MELRCPDCGKNDGITAETFGAQWDEADQRWVLSDEVTGPFVCQHCGYDAKYVDDFRVENQQ